MLGRTNTGGGGGGGLNFQVVGNPQPTNPKENTIWLNTDVKITAYDFSPTESENPVEGMAWISTGTSSAVAFDALKKNGIQVYPLSAKQYIGGTWVDVEAKSWQNGEWVDWVTYLYNSGNQFIDITGGWTTANKSGSKATFDTDKITISKLTNSYQGVAVQPKNKIDVSSFIKLVAEVEDVAYTSTSGLRGVYIGLTTFGNAQNYENITVSRSHSQETGNFTVEANIETVSGEYYPCVACDNMTGSIKRIYFM